MMILKYHKNLIIKNDVLDEYNSPLQFIMTLNSKKYKNQFSPVNRFSIFAFFLSARLCLKNWLNIIELSFANSPP